MIQENNHLMNNEEIQYNTLMPEGVDVSIEIVDHDFNKVYKADWHFTPNALSRYKDLSRERAITSLMQTMFNEELGMQLYAN